MRNQEAISGLRIFNVKQEKDHQILIGDNDHLLRRFGQLELLKLKKDQDVEYRHRQIADEIIFIDQGDLRIAAMDLRSASPSYGFEMKLNINEASLEAIIIPFGVAYLLSSLNGAKLIRMATHNEMDDEVQTMSKLQLIKAIEKK